MITQDRSLDNLVGKRIKELRKSKGLTQEQAADAAGINRSYLSVIENGHSSPTVSVLKRLAVCLEVSVESILEENIRKKVLHQEYCRDEIINYLLNEIDVAPYSLAIARTSIGDKNMYLCTLLQPVENFSPPSFKLASGPSPTGSIANIPIQDVQTINVNGGIIHTFLYDPMNVPAAYKNKKN